MNREEYLNEIISLVSHKGKKRAIRREIEDHLDDRKEFFLDAGYGEGEAEKKAIERMGSAFEVAQKLRKLHNCTRWKILSISFLIFFISGLVIADVFWTDFAIINIVDFTEVEFGVCFSSSLTFLSLVLSFIFAVKAESSILLHLTGAFAIIQPVLSLNAMLPFGYQVIAFFTDFPASLIFDEYDCFGNEVFCSFDHFLFRFGNSFASLIGIILILLSLAVALLSVFIGFVSQWYGAKLSSDDEDIRTEKLVRRFSKVFIIFAAIALIGTCAEFISDEIRSDAYQKELNATYEEGLLSFKENFDSVKLPLTKKEAFDLAKENGIPNAEITSDPDLTDIDEYPYVNLYFDSGMTVRVLDEDNDGIYETKQLNTFGSQREHGLVFSINLYRLKSGSEISELFALFDFADFDDYSETIRGNDLIIRMRVHDMFYNSYRLEYTNSFLTDKTS